MSVRIHGDETTTESEATKKISGDTNNNATTESKATKKISGGTKWQCRRQV